MKNLPHIRIEPFGTPTADQRICPRLGFTTRNQTQQQYHKRQQENFSLHNNNKIFTPSSHKESSIKKRKRRNCTSPVPRLEALVCPTLSERATQSLRYYVKHTIGNNVGMFPNCRHVHKYTPVDIYRCLVFDSVRNLPDFESSRTKRQ